jgi:hypothetical protein
MATAIESLNASSRRLAQSDRSPAGEIQGTASRRTLFTAGAAMLAGTVLAAATPASPDPDAHLIRLCAALDDLTARIDARYSGGAYAIEDDDERERIVAPWEAERDRLVGLINKIPATTAAGVRARATTIVRFYPDLIEADEDQAPDLNHLMVGALLRDLVGSQAPVPPPAAVGIPLARRPAASSRIGTLNQQLRALARRRDDLDVALVDMPEGPARDAMEVEFEAMLGGCLDLHEQILALPAESLEDAAVQAAIGYYKAGDLAESVTSEAEAERAGKDLRQLSASILAAIVRAAGMDVDAIGWGDMRKQCALYAAGGSRSAPRHLAGATA